MFRIFKRTGRHIEPLPQSPTFDDHESAVEWASAFLRDGAPETRLEALEVCRVGSLGNSTPASNWEAELYRRGTVLGHMREGLERLSDLLKNGDHKYRLAELTNLLTDGELDGLSDEVLYELAGVAGDLLVSSLALYSNISNARERRSEAIGAQLTAVERRIAERELVTDDERATLRRLINGRSASKTADESAAAHARVSAARLIVRAAEPDDEVLDPKGPRPRVQTSVSRLNSA